MNHYRRGWREKRKADGLCLSCPNSAAEGRTRCPRCLATRSAAEGKKQFDAKEAGLCVRCGPNRKRERAGLSVFCAGCLQEIKERRQAIVRRREA